MSIASLMEKLASGTTVPVEPFSWQFWGEVDANGIPVPLAYTIGKIMGDEIVAIMKQPSPLREFFKFAAVVDEP